MKIQALFSSKDKGKKIKCLLQFLFGALRVYQPTLCIDLEEHEVVGSEGCGLPFIGDVH